LVKALILAPRFDVATASWHPWLIQYLAPQLQARGVDAVILEKNDVVREKVWEVLSRDQEIKIILGVGHGSETTFTGQNLNEIFVACRYPPELIASRNFAPVSCLVGRKLLPDMVQKGLGAGLGETVEYVFYIQPFVDPLSDWVLALFTKSEFTYALRLAEGYRSAEAHAEMIRAYYNAARRVEDKDPEIAYALEYDADNRVHFGDPNWQLVPAPPPPGKYVCPWCEWSTNDAGSMQTHVWNVHVLPSLKPCILPRLIRKLLGCPLKK